MALEIGLGGEGEGEVGNGRAHIQNPLITLQIQQPGQLLPPRRFACPLYIAAPNRS